MRLAYFSPLPPQFSGIADYSADLLPYLARHAEIELFVDRRDLPGDPPLAARFPCHDFAAFADPAVRGRFDGIVYQLGNNPQHAYVYATLLRYPGVVVLHDYVLHHLVLHMTHAQGASDAYVAALGDAYGAAGIEHGRAVVAAERPPDYFSFPLSTEAIRASVGVIVHSRYLVERIRLEHAGVPVTHVPMYSFSLTEAKSAVPDPDRARRRLGLRPGQLLVGSFGFVVPAKRIEVTLRAFRAVREAIPDAHYVIVGERAPVVDLPKLIADLGLRGAVTATGSLPEPEFNEYLAAADICLNLRYPTGGETSGALIRMLGLGKPTIVSRTGAFFELPDAACVKVTPGAGEVEELTDQIMRLALDIGERSRLGAAALAWVEQYHRPEDAAARYVDFAQSLGDAAGRKRPIVGASLGEILCRTVAGTLSDLDFGAASERVVRQAAVPIAGLRDE